MIINVMNIHTNEQFVNLLINQSNIKCIMIKVVLLNIHHFINIMKFNYNLKINLFIFVML